MRDEIIDCQSFSFRAWDVSSFNLALVSAFFGDAADWFAALRTRWKGETAQPYLSMPTAEYHCAAAHPDNPTRAGPIDMLMAGLVAWNCHPVWIVRSNSASVPVYLSLSSWLIPLAFRRSSPCARGTILSTAPQVSYAFNGEIPERAATEKSIQETRKSSPKR